MDSVALTIIASTTVTLLTAFFQKAAEGFANAAGETSWQKVQTIYTLISARLAKNAKGKELVESLKIEPTNTNVQAELRELLDAELKQDASFGAKLVSLLREADTLGADSIFNTRIHGEVAKLIQVGVLNGDLIVN